MVRLAGRLATQKMLVQKRFSSSGSKQPVRPFWASLSPKLFYVALPVIVVAVFAFMPVYTLDEIGPADRFNWETKDDVAKKAKQ